MPIDTTTLNSEPSQALLGSGICSWLKQRPLHQFLALMQIESVSHVHLLGTKGKVILINSFNNPQILLISQNHFLHRVQYSVSLKPYSLFRHHISPKQLIIDMISGTEPHSGLGGPWPLQKKKNFPLDYEEKINRPPQH